MEGVSSIVASALCKCCFEVSTCGQVTSPTVSGCFAVLNVFVFTSLSHYLAGRKHSAKAQRQKDGKNVPLRVPVLII